jgi:uncharacterized iron-regulated membrane protein
VRNFSRVNFDLHRAAGLWFWIVLLVLAVTGVALNLRTEVATSLVSIISIVTATPYDESPRPRRRNVRRSRSQQ